MSVRSRKNTATNPEGRVHVAYSPVDRDLSSTLSRMLKLSVSPRATPECAQQEKALDFSSAITDLMNRHQVDETGPKAEREQSKDGSSHPYRGRRGSAPPRQSNPRTNVPADTDLVGPFKEDKNGPDQDPAPNRYRLSWSENHLKEFAIAQCRIRLEAVAFHIQRYFELINKQPPAYLNGSDPVWNMYEMLMGMGGDGFISATGDSRTFLGNIRHNQEPDPNNPHGPLNYPRRVDPWMQKSIPLNFAALELYALIIGVFIQSFNDFFNRSSVSITAQYAEEAFKQSFNQQFKGAIIHTCKKGQMIEKWDKAIANPTPLAETLGPENSYNMTILWYANVNRLFFNFNETLNPTLSRRLSELVTKIEAQIAADGLLEFQKKDRSDEDAAILLMELRRTWDPVLDLTDPDSFFPNL